MDVSILIEVLPDSVKADITNLEFGLSKGKAAVQGRYNKNQNLGMVRRSPQ